MRIALTSVFVDDQRAALAFYTDVPGLPSDHPAVKPFRDALVRDGIPLAQFSVDDVGAEYSRLTEKGVRFTVPPTDVGAAVVAVFDDTCGNLIQLIEQKRPDPTPAAAEA